MGAGGDHDCPFRLGGRGLRGHLLGAAKHIQKKRAVHSKAIVLEPHMVSPDSVSARNFCMMYNVSSSLRAKAAYHYDTSGGIAGEGGTMIAPPRHWVHLTSKSRGDSIRL